MTVLRDLIDASLDGEWGKGEPQDGHTPMLAIRGTDFETARGGSLATVPLRYIKEKAATRKSLQPRDLLIEVAGGSKNRPTGRTLYVSQSLVAKAGIPLTCASFCRFVRVNPAVVSPEYLFWHLQALYENRTLEKYHTQHTGVARFQWTMFADLETLDLPSLQTQSRIAAFLMAFDELIENNLRRIEILEEMAQAVYREWFVNFRFPGHKDVALVDSPLGPIPEGWSVGTLDAVVENVRSGTKSGPHLHDLPYVPIDCITARSMTLTESKPGREAKSSLVRFEEGDILFGAMRPYFHKVAIAPFEGVTRTTCFVLRPKKRAWLQFALLTMFRDETIAYATNHSRGSTIPYAAWDGSLADMTIRLPIGDLLERFGTEIAPMFRLAHNLSRQNSNLRTTRDLLLPKLVSGEIDVSELDIDTEWLAS